MPDKKAALMREPATPIKGEFAHRLTARRMLKSRPAVRAPAF